MLLKKDLICLIRTVGFFNMYVFTNIQNIRFKNDKKQHIYYGILRHCREVKRLKVNP